ncbi:Solute carrier family 25 member [Trichinella pseudospiralis]
MYFSNGYPRNGCDCLSRDTKPVTGGAFCYPPNLPMFVLAKGTSITMVVCSRSEFRGCKACTHLVLLGAGKAQRRRNMYAELEGLAESLSDDDHVEKVDIFIDEMNVHIDVEEGRLWGLFDRIELCSIAERTSYMHAGEIILRGGDIGHRRYWTTWLRRERRGNLTLVNYPEGLAKCRGHCSNILYINMLAIEHEEYSIVISETFGQADGKLN